MRRATLLLYICLIVTACGSGDSEEAATSRAPGESKHVVVDDAVINSGDVYAVIDPVWWTGDIYDDVKSYEKSLSKFSTEQRHVYTIVWYKATGRFSHPPSRDRGTRADQMDADEPAFDDLDTEFYELQDRKNIDAALVRYIKKNRSAFYFDGNVSIPQ